MGHGVRETLLGQSCHDASARGFSTYECTAVLDQINYSLRNEARYPPEAPSFGTLPYHTTIAVDARNPPPLNHYKKQDNPPATSVPETSTTRRQPSKQTTAAAKKAAVISVTRQVERQRTTRS